MLNRDHRVPSQSYRISIRINFGLGGAVEDDVKPVIPLQTDCSLVLVLGQCNIAYRCPTLHLDEPDLHRGPRIFRVVPSGDQIKPSVLALHALDLPATGFLVGDDHIHRDPLDLFITDHRRNFGITPFGMSKHPSRAQKLNFSDGAVKLFFELRSSPFETVVQICEPIVELL